MGRRCNAAGDVLRALNGTIPATSHDAVALQTAIRNLSEIMLLTIPSDVAAPRVGVAPSPRVPHATQDARVLRSTVSNDAAPPVLYPCGASMSLDTTSRARIRSTRFVHQRTTCNNNPFALLEDDAKPDVPSDENDPDCAADDATIHTDNRTVPAHPQRSRNASTRQPRPRPTPRTLRSAVTPRVLRSGHALLQPTRRIATPPQIPAPPMLPPLPLLAPTFVPTPQPTTNPSRVPSPPTQIPPIFQPVNPLTVPPRSPLPAFIKPDDDHDNDIRDDHPSKRTSSPPLHLMHHTGTPPFLPMPSTMSSILLTMSPPRTPSHKPFSNPAIVFDISLTLKKYSTELCTLPQRRPSQNTPN